MSVSLKTETRATQFAPKQQRSGEGNYQQRDQLLPIHGGKITPKSPRATRDLQDTVIFYCPRQNKICGLSQKGSESDDSTIRLVEGFFLGGAVELVPAKVFCNRFPEA
jgi:hypothetical protein